MGELQKFVIGELLKPIIRRVGTAAGAYLVGVGVSTDTANQIVVGLMALAGVAIDLANSHLSRKNGQ